MTDVGPPDRGSTASTGKKPPASSRVVRANMRRQKRRDTGCEMAVRRLLHASGARYRVDFRPLDSHRFKADIGWKSLKIAVFIDGCFWHGCPQHGTVPKTNTSWWVHKMEDNQLRDHRAVSVLEEAGWIAVRFWEHEPATEVVQTIMALTEARRDRCSK